MTAKLIAEGVLAGLRRMEEEGEVLFDEEVELAQLDRDGELFGMRVGYRGRAYLVTVAPERPR